LPPVFAVIVYVVVVTAGVVENVNVMPMLAVARAVGATTAAVVKSVVIPIVGPVADDTVIVQTIVVPTRAGFVFEHARTEAVVGVAYTTRFNGLATILEPPTLMATEYVVVVAAGVVEKV